MSPDEEPPISKDATLRRRHGALQTDASPSTNLTGPPVSPSPSRDITDSTAALLGTPMASRKWPVQRCRSGRDRRLGTVTPPATGEVSHDGF